MGFELNKLMKQYGVATPGQVNYSGAAAPVVPIAPTGSRPAGERPGGDDDAAKASQAAYDKRLADYDKQLADANAYKADPSAFNEAVRKYGLDQRSYDTYKTDYQNRLQNTPMYLESQFDSGLGTAASTTPTGSVMRVSADRPGAIGIDQANRNIRNWFTENPNASAAQIAAAKNEWSLTDADIRNAMGSSFTYGDGKPAGYGSTGVRYATGPGGIGMDKYNQNINQYITDNPYATTAQIKAAGDQWGVSNKDFYNATGSYYGNQLKAPTYGAVPLSIGNQSEQNKIDYYRQQRNSGYTDQDIRSAAETNFGRLPDSDWEYLRNKAFPAMPTLGGSAGGTPGFETIRIGGGTGGVIGGGTGGVIGGGTGGVIGTAPPFGFTAPPAGSITSQATVNYYNPTTGQTWIAPNGGWTAPAGWLQGQLDLSKAPGADVNFNFGAGEGGMKSGGLVHSLAAKYGHGGQVKTHYQTAGAVKLPSGYASAEEEADFARRFFTPNSSVEVSPIDMRNIAPAMLIEPSEVVAAPRSTLTDIAVNNTRNISEPVAQAVVAAPMAVQTPKASVPFGDERMNNIQALLAAYGPKDSAYSADLQTARTSAKAETDAFARMLTGAMNSPEDAQSSKAEMYFRLASAFGAPTKTGQFSENLGMVGKELGEYARNKRVAGQQKLALALEGQKMKMTAAKEDLNTLRALTGEEMKDKRAIATELIKDYIKSGEPQSAAGKQALDEGLKSGTKEYQDRVAAIGNMNVEGKMAQITASLANMGTAQANLALAQEKFQNQKVQQAKLSPQELKLKVETEDTLAQTNAALGTLKQAYALNPNTFDASMADVARRKALEVTDSKNPKVVATREQENLLEKVALSQLKSTFPGAISNDERKALQDVQGLGAKSREERAKIMKNAYTALQSVSARHSKRLDQINQGMYRDTAAPIEGGTE